MSTLKLIFSLSVAVIVSSCAMQHTKSYFESLPPNCANKSFDCSVQEALLATKDVLRTNPENLSVSCERMVEKKVDDAYKLKCKAEIEALATALSSKWKNDIVPINTGLIQYRWDLWDCIDGVNFGICRYYGKADIPVQWLAAPPN